MGNSGYYLRGRFVIDTGNLAAYSERMENMPDNGNRTLVETGRKTATWGIKETIPLRIIIAKQSVATTDSRSFITTKSNFRFSYH
jgi:hypothetical protein